MDDIERVARALAKQDRYSDSSTWTISPGFEVPIWLTYISEAKAIIRTAVAAKAK